MQSKPAYAQATAPVTVWSLMLGPDNVGRPHVKWLLLEVFELLQRYIYCWPGHNSCMVTIELEAPGSTMSAAGELKMLRHLRRQQLQQQVSLLKDRGQRRKRACLDKILYLKSWMDFKDLPEGRHTKSK